MVVPSRPQAAALLLGLDPPAWLLRHSAVVAEVAAFLAHAAAERGTAVDRSLVEAAALLHDVDKALPAEDHRHELGHGHAGASWLSDQGYAELAPAVAHHPVTRLADDRAWETWSRTATLESRIVAYADKRATAELVPMAERFADWRRRYPDSDAATDRAERRALVLEREVCAAAGTRPEAVDRLAWVDQAVADARHAHHAR